MAAITPASRYMAAPHTRSNAKPSACFGASQSSGRTEHDAQTVAGGNCFRNRIVHTSSCCRSYLYAADAKNRRFAIYGQRDGAINCAHQLADWIAQAAVSRAIAGNLIDNAGKATYSALINQATVAVAGASLVPRIHRNRQERGALADRTTTTATAFIG